MKNTDFIVPRADIYENDDQYIVVLDMPGTTKDGIEVTAEGDTLSISGKVTALEETWKPVSKEFALRDYKRDFAIGNKIDRDAIEAHYENGILRLELKKSEVAKPRKIEVAMN